MNSPRVSVCIATYNHERYIRECVMSVLTQALEVPLEVLIGDDQSSDRTGEIVQDLVTRFPETVRYFRHENRLGGCRNYQFLLERAQGEYVAHLDGDDYWLPGKLAKQVSMMDRHSEISASYTNALCIDESGDAIAVFNNPQPSTFDYRYLLARGNFLNNSSMLYRSSAKQAICDWPTDFVDYRIHFMLGRAGNFGYINTLGVAYRVNSNESMILNHGERVRESYWQAISENSADGVNANLKLSACADFLRRLFFRSVRVRSLVLLRKWWPIVSAANNGKKGKLLLLTVLTILATGYREVVSRVGAYAGGSNLRVAYWR